MSPKEKPNKPIAVYTRVSEQGRRSDEELRSHELQRAKVEHYLASAGLTASPEQFEDTDKSGGKMSRPAFDRAVAGVLDGRYGGIAVARLSRFGRTTAGILKLIAKIERRKGAVICLDPVIDTSTASGRAMLTVFSAFVTLEREQAIEQAEQVARKKLAEGEGGGGKPAVGYDFAVIGKDSNGKPIRGGYVPNAGAEHVRAAFELKASGGSLGKVADLLNERGVLTSRGNRWRISSAKSLIANEVYTGVRLYGGVRKVDEDGEVYFTDQVRIDGAHKAIVPAWRWRKCQPKSKEKVTRTRGGGHLLGEGLVRCGTCGGGMVKGNANGKYGTLRCLGRGGGHPVITYSKAADYIIDAAIEHIGVTYSELHGGGNAEEVEAAQARLAQAREGLAEVEALRGTIAAASFALAHSDALAEVETAEDALAALDRSEGFTIPWFTTPGGHRQHFDGLDIPDQRRYLHEVIESVTLSKAKGSAEERLSITFKDGSTYIPPKLPEPKRGTHEELWDEPAPEHAGPRAPSEAQIELAERVAEKRAQIEREAGPA